MIGVLVDGINSLLLVVWSANNPNDNEPIHHTHLSFPGGAPHMIQFGKGSSGIIDVSGECWVFCLTEPGFKVILLLQEDQSFL